MEKEVNLKQFDTEPYVIKHLHALGRAKGVSVSTTFELTSRCNFSCKMCYVHSCKCNSSADELTAEQWIELGRQAKEAGVMFLLITGGEPFLRDDFCEIYEEIYKMGFIVSLNTNLSLLNEKHIETLVKHPPNRINVSLYGTSNETYEKLCGVPAFETVDKNIKKLKSFGLPLKINVSITDINCGDFESIFNYCKENELFIKASSYMFPASRITRDTARLSPDGAARFRTIYDRLELDRETFLDRAERIEKGIEYVDSLNCDDADVEGSGIRCRAGSSASWIDKSGNMSFCGMIPAKKENNVLKLGFQNCFDNVRKDASAVVLPAKCTNCRYRYLCNICAASCFCETGGFSEVPEYLCKMCESTAKYFKQFSEELKGR